MGKYHIKKGTKTVKSFTVATDDEATEIAQRVARSYGAEVILFPGDGTRKPRWGWRFNYSGRFVGVIT